MNGQLQPGVRTENPEAVDRLAAFFPKATRMNLAVHILIAHDVQLSESGKDSGNHESTMIEFGTENEIIFRCHLPLEFNTRLRVTSLDGSESTEANVVAIQWGNDSVAVAARILSGGTQALFHEGPQGGAAPASAGGGQ